MYLEKLFLENKISENNFFYLFFDKNLPAV